MTYITVELVAVVAAIAWAFWVSFTLAELEGKMKGLEEK